MSVQIETACKAGVPWIQLRVKDKPINQWIQDAEEAKIICDAHSVALIINDSPEIAQRVKADGVHLGSKDMPVAEARKFLGRDFIIGATANSMFDLLRLAEMEIDYIGLGPFRFTNTKKDLSPVLGLSGIRDRMASLWRIKGHSPIPVVAVGGINKSDITELMKTGIHGVAVSSSINLNVDPEKDVRDFINLLNHHCRMTQPLISVNSGE